MLTSNWRPVCDRIASDIMLGGIRQVCHPGFEQMALGKAQDQCAKTICLDGRKESARECRRGDVLLDTFLTENKAWW